MNTKALLVLILCVACLSGSFAGRRHKTPLEKYVNNDDDSYDYTLLASVRADAYTVYVLNLTSQTWLSSVESSRPTWWHYLTICVPDNVSSKTAFLHVDGGSNTSPPPTTMDPLVDFLCRRTETVTALLKQVPNQPIVFPSDPAHTSRTEDAIIAFTWTHFMANTSSNPDWILQFPQVKSTVAAMDAIQDFTDELEIPCVKSFIMSGASKRGWTTWLAAGIDKRVEAFIPIVMPILNMQPNLNSAFRSLGGWTWTFADYFLAGSLNYFNLPQFDALAALIDPIIYNSRFTAKPTYIITSSQDEFFQPDSVNFFFKDLRGEKYLRVLPGAGHGFTTSFNVTDVLVSVNSFVHMVTDNLRGPTDLRWTLHKTTSRTANAAVVATSQTRPKKVIMWSTNTISTTARDFRLFSCIGAAGPACRQSLNWTATEVTATHGNIYSASRKAPAQGFGIFYLEFVYDVPERRRNGNEKFEFKVTTEVNIVPDVLPYPSCGTSCGLGSVNLANPTP
jgi:PhoPQ-activated pathogenicity-related protein